MNNLHYKYKLFLNQKEVIILCLPAKEYTASALCHSLLQQMNIGQIKSRPVQIFVLIRNSQLDSIKTVFFSSKHVIVNNAPLLLVNVVFTK